MKKFFREFKQFISRGNILDMAVGVIIGTAFSAIVTAFTNKIIMPLINWVLQAITGGQGMEGAYTFLKVVYTVEEGVPTDVIDLTKSIFIDWGAFITAILNFLIIAFTLFIIIKVAMKSSQMFKDTANKAKAGRLTKEQKAECKALGVNVKDKEAVQKYMADKAAEEEKAKAEAEEKAKVEEELAKQNSTEYLLKEIRDLLKASKEK